MKAVVVTKYFLAFLVIFLLYSCQKGVRNANAVITGFDQRMCICCGGLMVSFDGEAQPYTGNFKLIENSNELGISYNEQFPI